MDRILRSLCGWSRGCDVPSESTSSRVFQEFPESELPPRIHEALIRSCYENEAVGHISRDSTAIEAREAAVKKEKNEEEEKASKGSPMLERQREMAGVNEMVDALPKECNVGCKRSARGWQMENFSRRMSGHKRPDLLGSILIFHRDTRSGINHRKP